VLVLDQVTKSFVLAAADRLPATVIGGLKLEIVRNTGVSFSLFTGRGWLVTLVVCLVTAVMVTLFFTLPRAYSLPLALLVGGSIGNLIDRFRVGYVVDFVAVYWWPRFNVADLAIIGGAVLMVLTVMLHPSLREEGVDAGAGALADPEEQRGSPGTSVAAGQEEAGADPVVPAAADDDRTERQAEGGPGQRPADGGSGQN
jgi:signal peptidase II